MLDIITGFTSQDTFPILTHQPELLNRKLENGTKIITGFTSQDTVPILMHQLELPNRKVENETKKYYIWPQINIAHGRLKQGSNCKIWTSHCTWWNSRDEWTKWHTWKKPNNGPLHEQIIRSVYDTIFMTCTVIEIWLGSQVV